VYKFLEYNSDGVTEIHIERLFKIFEYVLLFQRMDKDKAVNETKNSNDELKNTWNDKSI